MTQDNPPVAQPDPMPTFRTLKRQAIDAFEENLFRSMLAEHNGNTSAVARVLRMDRKHLYDRLIALGLKSVRAVP